MSTHRKHRRSESTVNTNTGGVQRADLEGLSLYSSAMNCGLASPPAWQTRELVELLPAVSQGWVTRMLELFRVTLQPLTSGTETKAPAAGVSPEPCRAVLFCVCQGLVLCYRDILEAWPLVVGCSGPLVTT